MATIGERRRAARRGRELTGFLSMSGPERRAALDRANAAASEAISYYIPPALRPLVGLLTEANPVRGTERAAQASMRMDDPGLTPVQRLGNFAEMGTEVAGIAGPAAIATRAGLTPVQAVTEGLIGYSMGTAPGQAADALAYRLGQPSANPRTTLYSTPVFGSGGRLPRRPPTRYRTEEALQAMTQNSGTPEQMLASLRKNGASDTDIEWSGLGQWLQGRKKVTKAEIEDYLASNALDIDLEQRTSFGTLGSEEVGVDDLVERFVDQHLEDETSYYRNEHLPESIEEYGYTPVRALTEDDLRELAETLGEEVGDDFDAVAFQSRFSDDDYVSDSLDSTISLDDWVEGMDPEEMARNGLEEQARYNLDEDELRQAVGGSGNDVFDPGDTEYSSYFMPGVSDYTETPYVLRMPFGADPPVSRQHWESGYDPILVHTRTGQLPGTHFVGEIQSDWAQAAHSALKRYGTPIATYSQMQDITRLGEVQAELVRASNRAADQYVKDLNIDGLLSEKAELTGRLPDPRPNPGGPMMGSTNQWVDFALRRELENAVAANNDYIAFPTGETVRGWTYGSEKGQAAFYNNIVRQRMDKLLRSFGKRDAPEAALYSYDGGDGKTYQLYRYALTPELRDRIRRQGVPYLGIGAGGLLGANLYGEQEQGGI